MSLFSIADLHLSLNPKTNKAMDVFPGWIDYVDKIKLNWSKIVKPTDTVVVAGDISWAMDLNEAYEDFNFLDSLPGEKLILKGNHDYWWNTMKKMQDFLNENDFKSIKILHNNSYFSQGKFICGTRGWFYDNPEDKKVLNREICRLKASIDSIFDKEKEPIVFIHYPPIYGNYYCDEIMEVLINYGIKKCYYGHIHGESSQNALIGTYYGIEFRLISADFINFTPYLVI